MIFLFWERTPEISKLSSTQYAGTFYQAGFRIYTISWNGNFIFFPDLHNFGVEPIEKFISKAFDVIYINK